MNALNTGTLGHVRFPAEKSLGRRYPELPHPYRNDFQRDRDRIVHAHAFRRLEDKTQVFTPAASDHFRNRLTHTIEVSQIARTVAVALGLNEDLTEALALAHDIGHPPFAHAGEEELDRQMRHFGDRFDHNLHSLRIVEHFELRYARFPGLNLTFEVREGIVKHSRDFERGEAPELDDYLPGLRPPLEAQLIDVADEIAYNAADLDDALAAQFFTLDEIVAHVPQFRELADAVDTQFAGASDRLRFYECLRGLIDWLVSGFIEGTYEAARSAQVFSVADVREYPSRLACLSPGARETNTALKEFLRERVYLSDSIARERQRSSLMLRELFQFFLGEPERLRASEDGQDDPPHRRVCDYIAGMTDGFCQRTYNQLIGPTPPLVG
jgi:dGTPase